MPRSTALIDYTSCKHVSATPTELKQGHAAFPANVCYYAPYSGKFSEGESFRNFGKEQRFPKRYFLIFFGLTFRD